MFGSLELANNILAQSVWGSTDPGVTGANEKVAVRFKRGVDKVCRVPKNERFTLTPPPHILSVKITPLAVKLAAHTLPLRRAANHQPRNLRSCQHALTGLQPVFPAVSTYYFVGLQLKPPPFFRWRIQSLRACGCSFL